MAARTAPRNCSDVNGLASKGKLFRASAGKASNPYPEMKTTCRSGFSAIMTRAISVPFRSGMTTSETTKLIVALCSRNNCRPPFPFRDASTRNPELRNTAPQTSRMRGSSSTSRTVCSRERAIVITGTHTSGQTSNWSVIPQAILKALQVQSNARFREIFEQLGPGLITGAADDDPSGISTYSVTGATFGYGPLWTALFSFPLMCAVQLMCARLGLVTGRGLAGVIRKHYPRWVLWSACGLLIIANVFNIGADLAGMSDAMAMVTGFHPAIWTPIFAIGIVAGLIFSSYKRVAQIFKYLTSVLFAYILAAFLAHPQWKQVLLYTFVPHVEFTREYLSVLVGILGTTISPYLFFWQASQEVEEERKLGRHSVRQRQGATPGELKAARNDVTIGMFFSNLVMYFIILTSAATLHVHGRTNIETAAQAAQALRPIAGQGAYLLFALGIVGTGVLAVPVLAGSCAYAISEASAWRASLNLTPRLGRKFYTVLAVSVCLGLVLDSVGVNSVKMLFASAVLNGVLAPPLIVLVLLLTSSKAVMGKYTNGPWIRILGWACAAFMTVAAIAMFIV